MADEKIYVGNGKEHVFSDGGKEIKVRLCLDDMKKYHELYGFTSDKGRHFVNLIVSERREKDQYGNSHFVRIDTWKPDSSRSSAHPASTPPKKDESDDNIPF